MSSEKDDNDHTRVDPTTVEERYGRVKDSAARVLKEAKESITQSVGAAAAYTSTKGSDVKDKAAQGARTAIEYLEGKTGKVAGEEVTIKGVGRVEEYEAFTLSFLDIDHMYSYSSSTATTTGGGGGRNKNN